MKNKYITLFYISLVIPASILIAGCGVWGDFTTYFNLYYNTEEAFELAETAIKEQKKPLFSTEETAVPGSAAQNLTKVIEKSSKILQFSSETAYVDEALLLLGKAFFYQKNYLKGLRKFQELLATQPESPLTLETKLWIGKTQMRLRQYEEGMRTLASVIDEAAAEGEDEIVQNAFIEEIKYYLIVENLTEAIRLTHEFLGVSEDDVINAEAAYELGKLYIRNDELPNAVKSFERVFSYSPTYEIEYAAQIDLGRTLRDMEQQREALNLFTEMRTQDKYRENFDEIDLETGITLAELEQYDEAVDILTDVDTSYTTLNSGIAKLMLGKIYEQHYLNYDSAAVYYGKASTAQAPPEFIKEANAKNQLFKKYNNLRESIGNFQKSLRYLQDSTLFTSDSIAYVDYLDSIKRAADSQFTDPESQSQNRGRGNREFDQNRSTGEQQKIVPPVRPVLSEDSLQTLIIKNKFDLGNLFFTELNLPDSAYYYYTDILENYPRSGYEARVKYALGSYYEIINEDDKAAGLYNDVYSNHQDESIVNAAAAKLKKPLIDLNADPAKNIYSEAEKEMQSEQYAMAVDKFYGIFMSYPESPFAPKALYAGGWILENELNLPDSAAAVYDSILSNYPRSEYATKIQSKMSFYKSEIARIEQERQDSLEALRNAEVPADTALPGNDLESLDSPYQDREMPADSLNQNNISPEDTLNLDEAAPGDTLNQDGMFREDSLVPSVEPGSEGIREADPPNPGAGQSDSLNNQSGGRR